MLPPERRGPSETGMKVESQVGRLHQDMVEKGDRRQTVGLPEDIPSVCVSL